MDKLEFWIYLAFLLKKKCIMSVHVLNNAIFYLLIVLACLGE